MAVESAESIHELELSSQELLTLSQPRVIPEDPANDAEWTVEFPILPDGMCEA